MQKTNIQEPMSTPTKESTPLRKGGFASLGDLVFLLLLFLFSSLAGSLIISLFELPMPESIDNQTIYPEGWGFTTFLSYTLQMLLMLSLTLLYRRLRGGTAPTDAPLKRSFSPMLTLKSIIVLIALSIVIEPLLGLLESIDIPTPDPGRGEWTLLSVVVMAPLCEELLCRGILLKGLRARYGISVALIGSSLFFAVIHIHPVMMVNAFVLGLLFGSLALRSGSIWASTVLHAFNNGVALLLMWAEFPGERFDGRPMSELSLSEIIGDATTLHIIYGVALLICLYATLRAVRALRRMAREQGPKEAIIPAFEEVSEQADKAPNEEPQKQPNEEPDKGAESEAEEKKVGL